MTHAGGFKNSGFLLSHLPYYGVIH